MCGIDCIQPTSNSIVIDDWLEFEFPDSSLLVFRSAIETLIKRVLANPSYHYNDHDHRLVQTVRTILDFEETFAQLKTPANIGEKPRFFFPLAQGTARRVRQKKNPIRGGFVQSVNIARKNGRKFEQTDSSSSGSHLTDSMTTLRVSDGSRLLNGLANGHGSSAQQNQASVLLSAITLESKFGDYRDEKIFLLIRPRQKKSVDIAQQTNKWVFAPQTEKKILHYNNVSFLKYFFNYYLLSKKHLEGF